MMFEELLEDFTFNPEVVGFTEQQMLDMHLIALQMAMKENIPLAGWGIPEIPDDDTYCMYNPTTNESFDAIFIDNVLVPHYFRDTPLITPESVNLYPALTIADAIARYEEN